MQIDLIDWLIDWLISWLTDKKHRDIFYRFNRRIDWLIDHMIYLVVLIDWLNNIIINGLIVWMIVFDRVLG